ncbi:L-threonylcarbamoyladenylate synthase [Catalinimonas alkaloidigena]|uniref:Sua5/YciO/YrdC/YwlC family protein n=1 Tax=Catalinimonas alkaloidigena TaxID=1075417 RepID=UPI002406E56B|nr:Sua5/YciO/YrdC/YwlC family protein [Catalinimonas alkaloidigena]MDF9796901.1 L-threonylcarbamoyladenylate synthase [Catalinimonas alkaloidigena]
MKVKSTALLLLRNTPLDVIATHAFANDSIDTIIQNLNIDNNSTLPHYTILISREEDLHSFVTNIPELAWEMLEYAEEPLELLYPKKKYQNALDRDEFISIRVVKSPKLKQVVQQYGPLITISADLLKRDNSLTINKEINCSEKNNPYNQVKTMKLFSDGSFTFLR